MSRLLRIMTQKEVGTGECSQLMRVDGPHVNGTLSYQYPMYKFSHPIFKLEYETSPAICFRKIATDSRK